MARTVLTIANNSIEAQSVSVLDRQLINMPVAPNDTVEFRGWAVTGCTLLGVSVYCATVNTVGSYTLSVVNNATGNTVLNVESVNLNTLTPDTVTNLGLTTNDGDKTFGQNGRWTVTLTSNNAGLDAAGVYVDLVFDVS